MMICLQILDRKGLKDEESDIQGACGHLEKESEQE